jgi:large subunit ribosomal protein L35
MSSRRPTRIPSGSRPTSARISSTRVRGTPSSWAEVARVSAVLRPELGRGRPHSIFSVDHGESSAGMARLTPGTVGRVLLYCAVAMPKMKTHSGAKKRFKITAKGKVRGRHAFTSHILEKKSPSHKRYLGQPKIMSKDNEKPIKRLLGAKTK